MIKFLKLLGALWTLPNAIIIWPIILVPLWVFRQVELKGFAGFLVVRFDVIKGSIYDRKRGNWIGLALPFAMIVKPQVKDKRLVNHELVHNDQWLVLGPLFLPVYLLLLAYRGYKKHPLEVDAEQ